MKSNVNLVGREVVHLTNKSRGTITYHNPEDNYVSLQDHTGGSHGTVLGENWRLVRIWKSRK